MGFAWIEDLALQCLLKVLFVLARLLPNDLFC